MLVPYLVVVIHYMYKHGEALLYGCQTAPVDDDIQFLARLSQYWFIPDRLPLFTLGADNHLVELAIAGNAEAVVTANQKDFTGGDLKLTGLDVLNVGDFLHMLESRK